jgi:hypothetical protein
MASRHASFQLDDASGKQPGAATAYRAFPDTTTGTSTPAGHAPATAAAAVSARKAGAKPLLKCWLPVAITAGAVIIAAAVLLALYLPPLSPATPAPSPAPRRFLHLSDFHLDRLYNASYGPACFCNDPFVANQSDPATEAAEAARCIQAPPLGMLAGSQRGCDSPEGLVNSTLQLARAVLPDPEFILVTGDYVRHSTDGILGGGQARLDLILGTMDRVVELVQHFFPGTATHHAMEPLYEEDSGGSSDSGGGSGGSSSEGTGGVALLNMLGNNDLNGNYNLPVPASAGTQSPWLASVAPIFFSNLQANQSATFRQGGFYRQEVVPGLLHVLSLNTVIYSPSHRPSNVTLADPFGQLAWLEAELEQLAEMQQQRRVSAVHGRSSSSNSSGSGGGGGGGGGIDGKRLVHSRGVATGGGDRRRLGSSGGAGAGASGPFAIIVGHIPPTYDQVSFTQQWEQRFMEGYFQIVDRHRAVVQGQLFGHVHCNTYRLVKLPTSGTTVPVFLTSAFTPVYVAVV